MNDKNSPRRTVKIPKRIAAAVINSLKGGVVPRVGLPYITVGRKMKLTPCFMTWILFRRAALHSDLLRENTAAEKAFFCRLSAVMLWTGIS